MGYFDDLKKKADELKKEADRENRRNEEINETKSKANALQTELKELHRQYRECRESPIWKSKKKELFQRSMDEFKFFFNDRNLQFIEQKSFATVEVTAMYHDLSITLECRPDNNSFSLKIPMDKKHFTIIVQESEKDNNSLKYFKDIRGQDTHEELLEKIRIIENNIAVMKELIKKIPEDFPVLSVFKLEFSSMKEFLENLK